MRFGYKFSNLCGSIYKGGNVVFSPDGNCVYSPVGNRITVYDLVNHSSSTLPCENRRNITALAISPNGTTLVSVDEVNHCVIINLTRKQVIGGAQFRERVRDIQFSPDGNYLAVTQGRYIQVWRAPALITQFRPLILHRVYVGHTDDVTCLNWSADSLFFVSGSKDNTCRVFSLHSLPGFVPLVLNGHRSRVVGVYFGQAQTDWTADNISATPGALIYSISNDGTVYIWKWKARPVPTAVQLLKSLEEQEQSRLQRVKALENDDDFDVSEDDDSDSDDDAQDSTDSKTTKNQNNNGKNSNKSGRNNKEAQHIATGYIRKGNSIEAESRASVNRRRHKLLGFENPEELWDKMPFIARGTYKIDNTCYFKQDGHPGVVSCALYGTTAHKKDFAFFTQSNDDLSQSIGVDVQTKLQERLDAAPSGNLLVVGFSNGVFGLYQLPDFQHIHSLSISSSGISTLAINMTGDWLAIGCAEVGQLMVWEWQSESYILKQQSHTNGVNCLAYSPDGQIVATGGDDGKVKLWNVTSGFCFITFSDHLGPITHLEFTSSGTVVLSASSDGTIRAYDLIRYRNFRTLVAPEPTQFLSMTIDPSGEIVVAGGMDPFNIYIWSLQTGKLIDVLVGHTGPISSLAFSNTQSLLVSGSWDKTVRVWDIYSSKHLLETLNHGSDVLSCAVRFDGRELVTTCLNGNMYVWNLFEFSQISEINIRSLLPVGRSAKDKITSQTKQKSILLNSICYSADGTCIIAGGESRYVIIFDVARRVLLKRFPLSNNLSLDAMLAKLSSARLTRDGISWNSIDMDNDELSMKERRAADANLPGVNSGSIDYGRRSTPPAIRLKDVKFSPTGQQWAACTTEGLLLYTLDNSLTFDPIELDLDITPENVLRYVLDDNSYAKALVMALALNMRYLVEFVLLSTPFTDIPLVVKVLPVRRVPRLLELLATFLEQSVHIQLLLLWIHTILAMHGRHLMKTSAGTPEGIRMLTACRAAKRAMQHKQTDLSAVCLQNQHMLDYIGTFDQHKTYDQLAQANYMHQLDMNIKQEDMLRQVAITAEVLAQQEKWSREEAEDDFDAFDKQVSQMERQYTTQGGDDDGDDLATLFARAAADDDDDDDHVPSSDMDYDSDLENEEETPGLDIMQAGKPLSKKQLKKQAQIKADADAAASKTKKPLKRKANVAPSSDDDDEDEATEERSLQSTVDRLRQQLLEDDDDNSSDYGEDNSIFGSSASGIDVARKAKSRARAMQVDDDDGDVFKDDFDEEAANTAATESRGDDEDGDKRSSRRQTAGFGSGFRKSAEEARAARRDGNNGSRGRGRGRGGGRGGLGNSKPRGSGSVFGKRERIL